MAEIINLRRAKKAKARAEKEREASVNRALHGTSNCHRSSSSLLNPPLNPRQIQQFSFFIADLRASFVKWRSKLAEREFLAEFGPRCAFQWQ